MKFASIMPTEACDLDVTDYYMCFAELALESDFYATFYKWQAALGSIVLMDTLVYERNERLSHRDHLEAVARVQPTIPIAPDALGDATKTLKQFVEFRDALPAYMKDSCMVVLQGVTDEQYVGCLRKAARLTKYIGVPFQRGDNPEIKNDRVWWMKELFAPYLNWYHKLHFLGGRYPFDEEIILRNHPNVMGFDSTKVVAATLNDVEVPKATREQCKRPKEFYGVCRHELVSRRELLDMNLAHIRRLYRESRGTTLRRAGQHSTSNASR